MSGPVAEVLWSETGDGTVRSARARALWFAAARHAELRTEQVRIAGPGEVTVRALVSLVSAGTEMLVYRGELPAEDDLGLETCEGNFGFPVKYAYQVVGEVVAVGDGVDLNLGDTVFCRHPHQELFTIRAGGFLLRQVPPGLEPERAAFVNLLEVAVNCMLDVPIRHGDVVVVYGHGIVGSFCAQLARRTAGRLVVVDPIAGRRATAMAAGADAAVAPDDVAAAVAEQSLGRGADVCIEATGSPAALQSAIRVTGQEGTIVAVSYFGNRVVPLTLSPEFHYGRQRIISSQVSSLGSGLQPRWDFARRNAVAFDLLSTGWLSTPVSHRIPFGDAPAAYRLLDSDPADTAGVLLVYDGSDRSK